MSTYTSPWDGRAGALPFEQKMAVKHLFAKRCFDILFSLAALLALAPLFLLIAVAVRCSSPGRVFYSQERIGRGGKLFRCYKFRTMFMDAEERLERLLAGDEALRREWESSFKLKNDPRVTPLGRLLRATSLDELPQFWNVLKGDLSVVGPRPVVKAELTSHFGDKAHKILTMRPGLTGLWQVSGRSDVSYARRVALEERYVDTHSLLMDIVLILKTIPCMVQRKGAY